MRSLSTYLEILKKKGFYVCFQELRKVVQPIWITRQRGAIECIMQERSYRYLLRHYGRIAAEPLSSTDNGKTLTALPKQIWICWLQGEEQMPEIVKKCYASVKTFAPDYTITLITNDNLFDYVTLPDHIVQKFRKGTFTFTHFIITHTHPLHLHLCLFYQYPSHLPFI